MERCIAMETCVKNVAKNHNGMEMTREEFRAPLIALGASGRSAIDNIRRRPRDQPPKEVDTDRDHKEFESIDAAILFGNSLNCGGLSETGRDKWPDKSPKAPATMRVSPKGTDPLINPTVEYILHRWYGLEAPKDKYVRMLPTDTGKWCVYWKPSKVGINNSI